MKLSLHSSYYKVISFLFLFSAFSISAQEDPEILEAYEDYTEAAREVVYLHLNKSTYIKGEDLGFTAYVLDKKDKQPSLLTTNLYVIIEDKAKNIVASKLVRVINGVSANKFEIDSKFSSGKYIIKAYTNWMRNFSEQNYFIESIKVIDPKKDEYIEEKLVENTLDAQFLPESGHLLHGVENNIGVVIKDSKGYGVSNIYGEVVDQSGNVLSSFKTNKNGISKFPLNAQLSKDYKINVTTNNKDFSFNLNQKIEKNGVILSVKRLKSKIFVSIITNKDTFESVKNKRYTLMIHNGDGYDITDVYFTDSTTVTRVIEDSNSSKGINILTLFNENDLPIAERLFFNYEGLDILKTNNLTAFQKKDSLTLSLNYNTINPKKLNNISVSILPEETRSYNRHHNIVSYTYLQPYINGEIENGSYYFTDIDDQKKFELDHLLITQGWSSYDWDTIFNNEPNQIYDFEQGISLKANINGELLDNTTYMVHATKDQPPVFIDVKNSMAVFTIDNMFVQDNDSLYLSKINPNNKLKPAKLYLQAFPNKIPLIDTKTSILKPKSWYKTEASLKNNRISFDNKDGVQKLDEVVISTEVDRIKTRTRELSNHSFGTIKIPSEDERMRYENLSAYLRANMVFVNQDPDGNMVFTTNRNSNGPQSTASTMAVFLDDVQLIDTRMLYNYPLSQIDYVEINRGGLGLGGRGFNGAIMIYSAIKSGFRSSIKKTAQKHSIPLTFSSKKKFYVPKYRYSGDDFFRGYGVIDWKPELKVDPNGNLSITIAKPQVPIKLFIEGIANDGAFISEEKPLVLKGIE